MNLDDRSAAYVTALQELQRRAEVMAQGDLSALGQPVSDIVAIEDLL